MKGCVCVRGAKKLYPLAQNIVNAFIKTEHRTVVNGNLLSVMSQQSKSLFLVLGFYSKVITIIVRFLLASLT